MKAKVWNPQCALSSRYYNASIATSPHNSTKQAAQVFDVATPLWHVFFFMHELFISMYLLFYNKCTRSADTEMKVRIVIKPPCPPICLPSLRPANDTTSLAARIRLAYILHTAKTNFMLKYAPQSSYCDSCFPSPS